MKQIKKQLFAVLCILACLCSLSACGKAEESGGVDPLVAESLQQQTIAYLEQSIMAIPQEQITLVIEQSRKAGSEAVAAGLEGYMGSMEDLGAYQSAGEAKVKETDDGYQVTVDLTFEKRPCTFELGVSEDMSTITSLSFNPVYTTGENMTKALMNTLMGMGTVFVVLIFISLLIGCFKYINVYEEKLKKKEAGPAPEPAIAPAPVTEVSEAEENLADDLELAAVIAAAIAAAEGTSPEGLVVRSIRRAPVSRWKRA